MVGIATEAPDTSAAELKERAGFWLLMVGAVVMPAGLLFGDDQGVIGGALEGIDTSFNASPRSSRAACAAAPSPRRPR